MNNSGFVIRNAVIAYFKSHSYIDYDTLLNDVVRNYNPEEMTVEQYDSFIVKLEVLPETKKFDYQFNSVHDAINNKIRKTYKVNDGIELKITNAVDDVRNTITAFEDDDGIRYVKIKTNDIDTYKYFEK